MNVAAENQIDNITLAMSDILPFHHPVYDMWKTGLLMQYNTLARVVLASTACECVIIAVVGSVRLGC